MHNKIKNIIANAKYLNTFEMCVDSWQYCANN